jgi:hypothetical protein
MKKVKTAAAKWRNRGRREEDGGVRRERGIEIWRKQAKTGGSGEGGVAAIWRGESGERKWRRRKAAA